MKAPIILAAVLLAGSAPFALAQPAPPAPAANPGLGEVLVTAERANTAYAQQNRPVVGLRRRADSAVMVIFVSSDTREAATRTKEINTVLLSALDKAAASGLELVTGSVQLERVTKQNYTSLPVQSAGRVDTSRVILMVKVKLDGTLAAAQARLFGFTRSVGGSGRAALEPYGGITLTVINPDQYRDDIVRLVAADARHTAALFGPDFTFNLTGVDGQIAWSQVSGTEVFLYLPYRYNIVPKAAPGDGQ